MSTPELLHDAQSLHTLYAVRDVHAAKLKQLDAEILALESALIASMTTANLTTMGDGAYTTRINQQRVYSAERWEDVYARIQRTGEFDLLQKRLSSTAIRERENAGDLPAGVRVVLLPKIKIERVKT